MLRDRDEMLLQIMARLDAKDDTALADELLRLSPTAPPPVYPFLIRTERTTARTLADFIEAMFLPPNPAAVRH